MFFDDILIYSTSWTDHLRHLRIVLSELRRHQLFVKCSKCAFSEPSVAYLGHTISASGVTMDSAKVQAIIDWPVPRSVRAVRVAEPPKCLGPPAPAIVLRTSDGDAGSPPTLEVR